MAKYNQYTPDFKMKVALEAAQEPPSFLKSNYIGYI